MAVAGLALALAGQTVSGGQAAMTQPALSPDGSQIAFAAESAIWTVPAAGGAARLLISSAATESRPRYSPDGRWLAFDSTRSGNGDIYLYELATGRLVRLTWDDGMDALDGWSPDSQWVYFSSSSHNVGGMNDVYRVRVTGGTPMIVTSERYEDEYDAAAEPDGAVTFCTVGEMALSQWWRKGEAHIDQTEIWSVDPATMQYTRLVAGGAKQIWPMWTPDGRSLYFMSDRGGAENIWSMRKGQAPQAVTRFRDGRVLWPAMGGEGKTIVFERDFGIWKLDVGSGRAQAVAIRLEGAPPATGLSSETLTSAQEMAVSPDGKKIAFTAHGEVFAVGSEHGGESERLTHTGKLQSDLQWSPDSRHLAYISDRDGHDHIYEYNFVTRQERQLTHGDSDESHLAFSRNGTWLGYQRGTTELLALDVASGQAHHVSDGHFGRPPLSAGGVMAWSPDSQYVAYLSTSDDLFDNAFVVAASGAAPAQQVSYVPNSFGGSLAWSPDAKYLLFQTGQRTEPTRIARVDLVPHEPIFREDQFQKLFQEEPSGGRRGGGAAASAPPPATKVLYSGIAERLSLLPMLNARGPRISPDGKWLAYIGSEGTGGGNVYLYSLDDSARLHPGARGAAPVQLTSTATGKQDLQFTADSKEIYYLEGGKTHHVEVAGGQPKEVTVSAQLEVNFDQEKVEAFDQAWRYLRDNYMNPTMNGVNWDEVRTRYAPEVAQARTEADFRWLMSEMIGELNSSHSGISGGPPPRRSTGHLGVFFDRAGYESQGQFCVTEVVPLSPAALGGVKVGDCVTAVNGTGLGAGTNLDEVLDDTVGHKLTLKLDRGGSSATAEVEPVDSAAGKHLLYLAWVEHNRQLVDQLSHGQLGYIHMVDMSQGSLDQLYMDLDAVNFQRKGVIIDVRNNNGGFVNAYALDVLTRKPYLTMVPRELGKDVPARVALGQRALEKPTILVTNQNTLSDSEDFTEGYRAMHLGQVVGEPTAGWIIFTSAARLIDGSNVRMPTDRILDHDGKDMELHPRAVDVTASYPPGSWAAGKDPQLAAAVTALLAQLAPRQQKAADGGK